MSTALDQQPADELDSQPIPSPGLLNIAWRFKLLILLGTLVGLIIGYFYAAQLPPIYRSSASMLVLKKRPEIGFSSFDGRTAAMEDYLSTHKELISKPIIVDKAARKRNLKDLPTFAAGQNPTGAIIASLKVTREMGENTRIGTSILSLSFTGPVSEDC